MRCEAGSEVLYETRWDEREHYFKPTNKDLTCFLCMYEGILDAF